MLASLFFERLQTHYQKQLPFVGYRLPNETTVKGLLQTSETIFKVQDFTESGFVFAPFEEASYPSVLIPLERSKSINTEFEFTDTTSVSEPNVSNDSEMLDDHVNLVNKGITEIENGSLTKVVLSRQETVAVTPNTAITIFKRLLQTYTSAFVYCWYHPKIGLWLGATPETLLTVKGNRLKTMALAGTQTYAGTLDVAWGQKEQHEQQVVTNFIVDSLKTALYTSNTHAISVSPVKTVKAGKLLHLKTDIVAQFKSTQYNLKKVLKALHPTPAVCGFPKTQAKQFISANETYEREYYTGFLGELNIKTTRARNRNRRNVENNVYQAITTESHLFVNLRCMQLQDEKALVYVGGGITKDSVAEHEFKETQNKAQTMLRVLMAEV